MGSDPKDALHTRVENDLTTHYPTTDSVAHDMDMIRAAGKNFAHMLIEHGTVGRELSTALTKVEEATFHAIASVARNQGDPS